MWESEAVRPVAARRAAEIGIPAELSRSAGFMKPAWNPKRVETKQPRGARTTGVLPRYVRVGRYEGKAFRSEWLIEGRVSADYDAEGNLIGVEVLG